MARYTSDSKERVRDAIDFVELVNARAVSELGWSPRYDFGDALGRLQAGEDHRSPLAAAVGAKGYHSVTTGPYTVRSR